MSMLYPRDSATAVVKKEDMGRHFVITSTTTGAGVRRTIRGI
jgi:hypothetical protein